VTKFTADGPYADPEAAAKRILEIANAIEPAMKGRIYIELVNDPFLFRDGGSAAEYAAGLRLLTARKQLFLHESGTFVWLPDAPPLLDGNRLPTSAELLPDSSTHS
jgi:hypothetical protein